jgi:hypothetical protein
MNARTKLEWNWDILIVTALFGALVVAALAYYCGLDYGQPAALLGAALSAPLGAGIAGASLTLRVNKRYRVEKVVWWLGLPAVLVFAGTVGSWILGGA